MKNENLILTGKELYGLRKRAVQMKKRGHTVKAVASAFGVGKSTVDKWWALYRKGGLKALKPSKRGRKTGQKRNLSPEREAELRTLIADKTPDQLKMPFALWTRRAVVELVRKRYRIKMPIRTVGEYLKRWGYTPQKPLKKAYEQNPKAVRRWLDEQYPVIRAQAKTEGAEIHWADETGLRSDSQHGRSYAPQGQTPVLRLNAKRVSANMISTVTNQGKVRFMVFDGGMNAQLLIKFFKRLLKDAKRKVFVILDNLRVHHAKIVKAWVSKHAEQIELFFLPSYSPELNPDEYLNCDLKAGVHSREPARNQIHLKKKIISHMRMLQKSSARVRKYFEHNKIKYAA
ncbi:MAG: IS630 family transposase [FCB group bacterium]|nr:IS630 family transposase [FCB group bacterium]